MRDDWVRPRPGPAGIRRDAAGALLVFLGALVATLLYSRLEIYSDPAPVWLTAVALLGLSAPLALRRVYPISVALVVSAAFFVIGQFQVPEMLFSSISLFIALYSVGAWSQHRLAALWARVGITVAMLVWVVVNLILMTSAPESMPGLSRSGLFSQLASFAAIQVITNLLYFAGAFFFGSSSWRAARTRAFLRAQSSELAEERRTSAAQAVAIDRLSIARELHDVVAHHVSVMGIQAGAARRSLDRDPEQARASLGLVEDSAHAAVAELQGLLHTLRSPELDDPASTVGLAQLPALVAAAQANGTPTELMIVGSARPLPMLIDVALYRVSQEALTNVRKHAGPDAPAEVRLRYLDDAIELEIADEGISRRIGRPGGSGLGLIGMRERVGALGGSLATQRRERGGFLVRARIPLAPEAGALPDEPRSEAPE